MLLVISLLALGITHAADPAHNYVGAAKCKSCHKKKKSGNQYGAWQKASHSKAYQTLGTPKAKEVAKKAGVAGDPQKAAQCLECHVTAYGVDKKFLEKKYNAKEGVSCESCHGPGKDYKKKKIMKDHDKSIAAGMIMPDEKLCKTCHNEKSPTYKPFVYKEKLKKVSHPIPGKK